MNHLKVKKTALAFSATCALLYFGCVMLMWVLGEEGAIRFFNYLLHGIDTSGIVRMNISLSETFTGFLLTLVIGWIFGAFLAWVYNFNLPRNENP